MSDADGHALTDRPGEPLRGPAPDEEPLDALSPSAALAYGMSLQHQGAAGAAAEVYRRILEVVPDYADAMQYLGVALHQQGRSDEAAPLLYRATSLAPGDAGIWNNLGNVLAECGDAERAAEAYERAIALAPDYAAPYSNLGTIRSAAGAHSDAEAAYRRAIALAPDFAPGWHNLANLLFATDRTDEAIRCGLRAVTLAPRDPGARALVGIAYAYLGELENAAAIYREWLDEDPDNAVAQHYLAACEPNRAPDRASDGFIESVFDSFSASFEAKLARLDFRAPDLVAAALRDALGKDARTLHVLDAGCGTGLSGRTLRPMATRLTGVDLSAGMLAQAARANVYDALEKAELTAYLSAQSNAFDAIVACDVLCYFGALDVVTRAAADALAPGGLLVITTEAAPIDDDADYRLQPTGRYIHAAAYLDRVLAEAGLRVCARRRDVLRSEHGHPVEGWVVTARCEEV